jgi:hypothetical protein
MAKPTKTHEHRQPVETKDDKERNVVPATYGGTAKVAAVPKPGQPTPSRDEWTPAPKGTPGNWDEHDRTMEEASRHDHYIGHDGKANAPAPFKG